MALGDKEGSVSPPPSLAFADRLKPVCTQHQRSPVGAHVSAVSHCNMSIRHCSNVLVHRSKSSSPRQLKARDIIRKYMKAARRREFRRLRMVVPAVADNEKATQSEILEESIKYIDELHSKLLDRVNANGLPARLRKGPNKQTLRPARLTSDALMDLLGEALQPQVETAMRKKRREDNERLARILAEHHRRLTLTSPM